MTMDVELQNISPDALSLGHPGAPPIDPGDKVTLPVERFVGTAWPHSTWKLIKKPGRGYHDHSPEDAYLFLPADAEEPTEPTPSDTEESS